MSAPQKEQKDEKHFGDNIKAFGHVSKAVMKDTFHQGKHAFDRASNHVSGTIHASKAEMAAEKAAERAGHTEADVGATAPGLTGPSTTGATIHAAPSAGPTAIPAAAGTGTAAKAPGATGMDSTTLH